MLFNGGWAILETLDLKCIKKIKQSTRLMSDLGMTENDSCCQVSPFRDSPEIAVISAAKW